MDKITINKKLTVMLIITITAVSFSVGVYRTKVDYQPKIQANKSFISSEVEKVVEQIESEERANKQLYRATAENVDTGEKETFYFRTSGNPFNRVEKIAEKEGSFENISVSKSDLLEEENNDN